MVDTAGQKIGTISDVRYNEMLDPTGDPEWLIVKAGVFGTKRIYIPARDVRMDGDRLRVPYTEDRVKDSPAVAKDQPLTRDEERELYIYYGLELTEPTVTAAPSPCAALASAQTPTSAAARKSLLPLSALSATGSPWEPAGGSADLSNVRGAAGLGGCRGRYPLLWSSTTPRACTVCADASTRGAEDEVGVSDRPVLCQGARSRHQGVLEQPVAGVDPPRSAPQALIPKLNDMGDRGWELVSLQPVFIDEDANVLVHGGVTNPQTQADDMITGMIKAKVRVPIPTSSGPPRGALALHERVSLRIQAATGGVTSNRREPGWAAGRAAGAYGVTRVPPTSTASMVMYLPLALSERRRIFTVCVPAGRMPVENTFCW